MTATILPMAAKLTLMLTAKDNGQDDDGGKAIFLDMDKPLIDRFLSCVAEADRMDAWVTLALPGGFEEGARNMRIEVRVSGHGEMDFKHEIPGYSRKTITYVTGILRVSMIEKALEKIATFPGQAGLGILLDSFADMILVDRERVEKIDDEGVSVRPKPGVQKANMLDAADAIIYGPRPEGMDKALQITIG